MRRAASSPSITGIITSIRITSMSPGLEAANASTACRPSAAFVTTTPSFCSMNSAISMFRSLSSTSSTFVPRMETAPPCASSSARWASLSCLKFRRTVNVEPTFFSLCSVISPPIFSTSSLTMAKPRPVPTYEERALASSCANGSNALCWNASLMPLPVSRTVNSKVTVSSVSAISREVKKISPPTLLYFTALPSRFCSTCRTCSGLPNTWQWPS